MLLLKRIDRRVAVEGLAFIECLESRLLLSTPDDPLFDQQWGLSASGASSAWDQTRGSPSVVVAGIDTGIDYEHPDLYLNVWINQDEIPAAVRETLRDANRDGLITFYDLNAPANKGKVKDVDRNGQIDAADLLNRAKHGGWSNGRDEGGNGYADDIIGWDFAHNDNNPLDHDGHGTHTAGTIAAVGNNGVGVAGVAWRASVMALKIFTDAGDSATARAIAAAIRYAADNGARVSNNSWGGTYPSSAIYNAIAYAQSKGHIFVATAGNDASDVDSPWVDEYPAEFDLSSIITVGASDSSGGLAYYSNYGRANVDIVAPGSSVLSTYVGGGYRRMSGTSMATPHVTGAVALILSRNPGMTAAQVKAALIQGADQSAGLARASVSGGELNVVNALAGVTGRRYEATPDDDAAGNGGTGETGEIVFVWLPGFGWVPVVESSTPSPFSRTPISSLFA
jgi:serine protease